jgi:hypothetical protein
MKCPALENRRCLTLRQNWARSCRASRVACVRRRPITIEFDWTEMPLPSLRGALATKQSRGRVLRPLDCLAGLAITGGELARLFLRVALVSWQRKFKLTHYPRSRCGGPCSTSTCQPREREDSGFHDRMGSAAWRSPRSSSCASSSWPRDWMPAFAGMTRVGVVVHVRLRERRSFVTTVSRRDQGRPKRGAELAMTARISLSIKQNTR